MSERYPGGIISPTAPVPSGSFDVSTAPGVWTLEQQAYWARLGQWPTAGNTVNYIENVFQTWLYTGNGATQTITNGIDLAGKGGMVWTKCRSTTFSHQLYDTVRGTTKALFSNLTDAQSTISTGLTAFNTDGYTLGSNGAINTNTQTYASWTFAEQAKFFDVVTYTGNGTARTIAHNLGSVPGMIIVKATSLSGEQWFVWHRSISTGNLTSNNLLRLNLTNAQLSIGNIIGTASSTSFEVGTDASVNDSGSTYVAYLFAHNAGGFGLSGTDNVISCGSFTTDGSQNATVNLGYEPQYVLCKRTNLSSNWWIFDVMRGMSYTSTLGLAAQSTGAETDFGVGIIRPTATGFNCVGFDSSGNNWIYMAIRKPMAPPTLGTQVFSPSATSAGDGTTITTGFPVDMQIWRGISSVWTLSNTVVDRLRGNSSTLAGQNSPYLLTSSTAAESIAYNNTQLWSNTGFNVSSTLGGVNSVYYNFSRRPGFFDVVCYTGTGSNTTQAHNLGAVPELMIIKKRNATASWQVYTAPTGNTLKLILEENGPTEGGSTSWNSTTPTSSVFSLGTDTRVNGSGDTFVNYLFASVAGVSKVGSYTGTGATQTINAGLPTGARFVLIKRTDSTGNWWVWDTARGMVTSTDPRLALNSTAAELNNDWVLTTTNGFQIVTTDATVNASGGTYIYLAIA